MLKIMPFLLLFLAGCVTEKHYKSIVQQKFKEEFTHYHVEKFKWDNVYLNIDSLEVNDVLKVTVKRNSPIKLILTGRNNLHVYCQVPSAVPFKYFASTLILFDHSVPFNKYLEGKRLDIFIKKLPDRFVFAKADNYYYAKRPEGKDIRLSEIIFPLKQTVSINYQLSEGGNLLKSGNMELITSEGGLANELYSLKNDMSQLTRHYLEAYKVSLQNLYDRIFSQLIKEIKVPNEQ
jgi:hypothetical protein